MRSKVWIIEQYARRKVLNIQGGKFIDMLKTDFLQGKINLPVRCLLCMQTTGCMAEYFITRYIFLQNINN